MMAKSSTIEGCMDDKAKATACKLVKECEALAVSGYEKYDDEIDVIGPVELLKQLFDTCSLKEDVISIAVQVVGKIFVLQSWEPVTSLTWLDKEMPSVSEVAICYDQKGVLQGYVHGKPHTFQQNGLCLLKFLQSECKSDPGAYWLYKSAGEDEIQCFDLNHFSSPLPSSIHSERRDSLFSLGNLLYRLAHWLSLSVVPNEHNICVRLLRKCLNILKEPAHMVVRAYAHEQFAMLILNGADSDTSSSPAPLLSNLAAVHHISQAIMSLRSTRHLQSPKQEDSSHHTCVDLSRCACGDPDCIELCDTYKCLPIDRKLWKLVRLLGEYHLSLGKAYGEDGQVHQALDAVKTACSLYGSMPEKFEEPLSQVEDLAAIEVENLKATGELSLGDIIFWAKVWRVVGTIYFDFFCFKSPESSVINHLNLPSEVLEEVDMLKKKYSGSSASSHQPLKYLTGPTADDSESNLLAALNCYEETRRLLQKIPSSLNYDVLKELSLMKCLAYDRLGEDRLTRNEIDKAEESFTDALAACKEFGDHTNAIITSRKMGYFRKQQAVEKLEALKRLPRPSNNYQIVLETAKKDYTKSICFLKAAKKASDKANTLKTEVYVDLADVYLRYGKLLEEEETKTAAIPYFRKGVDLCESLGGRNQEVTALSLKLARLLRDCCMSSLETDNIPEAQKYSSLANTYWQKSMDNSGPKNFPSIFLAILIERSDLSLSVSNYFDLNNLLDSALNVLLQGRHINAARLNTGEQKIFCTQLQKVLKGTVTKAIKSCTDSRVVDKLRRLYEISIRSNSMSDLAQMNALWTSP